MGTVNDKIKNVIRNWLEIQPSVGDTITIQETNHLKVIVLEIYCGIEEMPQNYISIIHKQMI